jgi:hypothetical protein
MIVSWPNRRERLWKARDAWRKIKAKKQSLINESLWGIPPPSDLNMKKPKRKKPKENVKRGTAASNSITDTAQAKPTDSPRIIKQRRWRSSTWMGWKNFWAVCGPVLSVIGTLFLLMPQISIDASVNLDPSQPLATQFIVANRGRVPIHDLSFACGIGRGPVYIGQLTVSSSTLLPVEVLPAGASVTRGCAVSSANIEGNLIVTVTASFRWPIIGLKDSQTAQFSIRRGAPGFFMVPE